MIIKEVKDPEEDQTTLDGEVEEEERDNKTFIQSYSEMTLQTNELQFTFQENESVKVNSRELPNTDHLAKLLTSQENNSFAFDKYKKSVHLLNNEITSFTLKDNLYSPMDQLEHLHSRFDDIEENNND